MDKTFIDKLAFIQLQDKKLLVTRSHGKDVWYVPGGKREEGETDVEALVREVKEELTLDIVPESAKQYGVFEAQAHGKPAGTVVRMTCYTADSNGKISPAAEIDEVDFFSYDQVHRTSDVDHLIFNDLKDKGLIV